MKLPLDFRSYGTRVVLRAPRFSDAGKLVQVLRLSETHLAPWSPVPDPASKTLVFQRQRLRIERQLWAHDRDYRFVLSVHDTEEIAGRISLSNISRGVFLNCTLGYWLAVGYEGQGLMTEGIALALTTAFGALGLHRVQAAIIPRNRRSLAVVSRLGFREEGLAQRYLRIAGQWEDHRIFALTAEEWFSARGRAAAP